MEQAVPLIYTRDTLPPPLSVGMRMIALGFASACLAVLVTGAWLTPSGANGIGTHTQLGLQRCQFEARMGVPCLTCGFTTAVSYFAHGNVLASLYVQPMGFTVGVLFAVGVWVGAYVAFTGRPVHRLLTQSSDRRWLLVLLTITIVGWAWKIAIHLTGRDHWPP